MAKNKQDFIRSLELAGVTLTEAKLKEFWMDDEPEATDEVPAEDEMAMDGEEVEGEDEMEMGDGEFTVEVSYEIGGFLKLKASSQEDAERQAQEIMDQGKLPNHPDFDIQHQEAMVMNGMSMDGEEGAEEAPAEEPVDAEAEEAPAEVEVEGDVEEAPAEESDEELSMDDVEAEGDDVEFEMDIAPEEGAEEVEMSMDDELPADDAEVEMSMDDEFPAEDEMAMDDVEGEEMFAKEPKAPKPEDVVKAQQERMDDLVAKLKVYKELLPLLPEQDRPHFDSLIAAVQDELASMDIDVAFGAQEAPAAPAEAPAAPAEAAMRMDDVEGEVADVPAEEPVMDMDGELPVEDAAPEVDQAAVDADADEMDKEMRMYMADMEAYMKDVDLDVNTMSMKDAMRFDREGLKMFMANMDDNAYNDDEDMKMYMKLYMKQMYMDKKGLDETTMRKRFQKNGAKVDAEAREMYLADKEFNDKEFRQMYMNDIGYH